MTKKFLWFMSALMSVLYADSSWMDVQIQDDLAPYHTCCISPEKAQALFESGYNDHLVRFSVLNGKVTYCHPSVSHIPEDSAVYYRTGKIYEFLCDLARRYPLPNLSFYVSMHDGIGYMNDPENFPVFTFCRKKDSPGVLMPDFHAVSSNYKSMFPASCDPQVDESLFPFASRQNKLVFRGNDWYHLVSFHQSEFTPLECTRMQKRHELARLSKQYPDLIDAGLISFNHWGPEMIAIITPLKKSMLTVEEILNHKYQMWIDGTVTSYTSSGWRFYTGSCVIKPDSEWVQWYFSGMQEGVHYIGVKEDLTDLVDTIHYLNQHQDYAQRVGQQGLQFVREHLSKEANLLYMYKLLCAYADLPVSQVPPNRY